MTGIIFIFLLGTATVSGCGYILAAFYFSNRQKDDVGSNVGSLVEVLGSERIDQGSNLANASFRVESKILVRCCLVVVSRERDSWMVNNDLFREAGKSCSDIDSGKASRADSIGINTMESENKNVHDHGNYGVAIPLVAIEEAKYGIERVMLNNGFFFFQFSRKKGMEQDKQCPKKVKVAVLTKVLDDVSVEVTRKHGNGKRTA
ncbi:hypothetical protein Tco_0916017 [Tanacetum coccineum]